MQNHPILEKALKERQQYKEKLQKLDEFIATYMKMAGLDGPPPSPTILEGPPQSKPRIQREKPKGREMGEPRKSITEWMMRKCKEDGAASYEDVCKAFPHVDKVEISKILDRNRKKGFDFDKTIKKWVLKEEIMP